MTDAGTDADAKAGTVGTVQVPTRSLWIAYLSVAVDIFGISAVLPIVPFLVVEHFEASPAVLGFIYAGYSGMQMLFLPLSGRLSDKYGRKPALVASLAGSCLGLAIQGASTSLGMFVAGRMVAGAFAGSQPIAQSYIADVVPIEQRPRYYAQLGAVLTLCFCFGPGIGAGLAEFSLFTPMQVCSALAGCGTLFCLVYFQERTTARDRALSSVASNPEAGQDAASSELATPSETETANRGLYRWATRLLYLVSFLFMFDFAAFLYFFGVLIHDRFGWESLEYGFLAMGVSIVSVIAQLTLYSRVQTRFGKHGALSFGMFWLGVGTMMLGGVGTNARAGNGAPLLIISIAIMACGYACANPSITATASRYAAASAQGSIQGTSAAMQAVARTVGSVLWGLSFGVNPGLPFVLAGTSGLLGAVTSIYVLVRINYRLPEHLADKLDPTSEEQGTAVTPTAAAAAEPAKIEGESLQDENARLRREITALRAALALANARSAPPIDESFLEPLILNAPPASIGDGAFSTATVVHRARTGSSGSESQANLNPASLEVALAPVTPNAAAAV